MVTSLVFLLAGSIKNLDVIRFVFCWLIVILFLFFSISGFIFKYINFFFFRFFSFDEYFVSNDWACDFSFNWLCIKFNFVEYFFCLIGDWTIYWWNIWCWWLNMFHRNLFGLEANRPFSSFNWCCFNYWLSSILFQFMFYLNMYFICLIFQSWKI